MFSDHSGSEANGTMTARRALTGMACALALLLGCGDDSGGDAVCGDSVCASSETATSCAVDCGCGNGVVGAGESCDGTELGDATCMSAVQRGGTLACDSDCTLDVSGCNLPLCGNGQAEEGESCDGDDLGTGTCDSVGFTAGDIACTVDCTYDLSACCTDTCLTEGAATCVGDSLRACTVQADGCLAWQVTDCAATNEICDDSTEVAVCNCVDRCTPADATRCEGATIETCTLEDDGCLDWVQTTDCGTASEMCAVAPSGPICVPDVSAEDCSDPYPLSPGDNVVAWAAVNADYMTTQPSCNTTTLEGPDVVMSYTPAEDGFVTLTINKPTSARQVMVVSSGACGTLTPEVACLSDFSPATLVQEFGVTMGTTYYVYVRDTSSGTAPLDNPLIVNLSETLCSTITVTASNLSPADATSIPSRTPILSVDFDYPVSPAAGVITVTGDLGTNLSYDLATSPLQVSLTNGGKTLVIDPGIVFPAGENVSASWTGLTDATCSSTVAPPASWTFEVTGPPCQPGTNGMVGTTVTRVPTPIASITEYYVAADTNPTGYVYVGGTTQLYRTPKAGGITEDVVLNASLLSSNLGYDMLIAGDDIFTLESSTSATTGVLWRISTSGGATWAKDDYMLLPQTPTDDLAGITEYKGRIYMIVNEFSSTTQTQIWSVAAGATVLPETAVLETSFTGQTYCSGIAVDDSYFYVACGGSDRLLRIDRTTFAAEVLTDVVDLSTTKNAVHAHDFDNDGSADALYVQGWYEDAYYVCEPGGAGPFWVDVLASFGTSSSSYGLGFDPVANTLWMFDDDTREFIKIE